MEPRLLSSSTINGTDVRNPQGENLGNIKDLMIDLNTGHIAYAVLSFGGFLGLGDKYFAIPWEAFSIDAEDEELVLDVDKEVLKDAPGFDKDNWPSAPDRTFIMEVHSHYGYEPYWTRKHSY